MTHPGEQIPSVSARPYRLRKTGCGTDGRGLKSPRPPFVSGGADTDAIRTKRTDTDGWHVPVPGADVLTTLARRPADCALNLHAAELRVRAGRRCGELLLAKAAKKRQKLASMPRGANQHASIDAPAQAEAAKATGASARNV